MARSGLDALREALAKGGQGSLGSPGEPVKSMCVRNVPEWVHEDYRMLKALCRRQEPTLTINELLVEALREDVGVAYAKRGKGYAREEG